MSVYYNKNKIIFDHVARPSDARTSKCQGGTDPRFPAGNSPIWWWFWGKISPHGELNGAKSVPVGFRGGGSGVPPLVLVPRGDPIIINLCSMFGFLVAISSWWITCGECMNNMIVSMLLWTMQQAIMDKWLLFAFELLDICCCLCKWFAVIYIIDAGTGMGQKFSSWPFTGKGLGRICSREDGFGAVTSYGEFPIDTPTRSQDLMDTCNLPPIAVTKKTQLFLIKSSHLVSSL